MGSPQHCPRSEVRKKRLVGTNSTSARIQTTEKDRVTCFGVSQGYYAVSTGLALGTSSLGPCFALIAWDKDQKVILAHVHADTTVVSPTDALDQAIAEPVSICIVRGKNLSQSPQVISNGVKDHYERKQFKVAEEATPTAAVVCSAQGALSMPSDLTPRTPRTTRPRT